MTAKIVFFPHISKFYADFLADSKKKTIFAPVSCIAAVKLTSN